MDGWRVQSVDLTGRTAELLGLDPLGSLFLGCDLEEKAERLDPRRRRADLPGHPVAALRPVPRLACTTPTSSTPASMHGYDATPDAQIYAWSRQHDEKGDTSRTLAAALHDHAIADALTELPDGRPWIGVMGGHGIARGGDDVPVRRAASAALSPGPASPSSTGGGPGAMEAANLGSSRPSYDDSVVDAGLVALAAVPVVPPVGGGLGRRRSRPYAVSSRATVASRSRPGSTGTSRRTCSRRAIAKYFSNAQREDVLLSRARGGIIYLPGAAGTVQEIFQAVTPNYYGDQATQIPMILVGVHHWTVRTPSLAAAPVPGGRAARWQPRSTSSTPSRKPPPWSAEQFVGGVVYGARHGGFCVGAGGVAGCVGVGRGGGAAPGGGAWGVPVTLRGLAERHEADAARVGQPQHVDDIVSVVEGNDLRDVVLAGHSYSGIPVGQAAARIGDRLRRVVYVDSNIPTDGRSFIGGWSDEGRAWVEGQLAESGGFWPPLAAEDYVDQDLSDETIAVIVSRSTPHPGRAISEPAHLVRPIGELPTTYIKCLMDGAMPSREVAEQLESPNWELVELPTGHWPMFSQPSALAKILTGLA